MMTPRRRFAPTCSKAAAFGVLLFSLATQYGRADSVLVGTDLSGLQQQGGRLCPQASNCAIRAQEFTLLTPVQVSSIELLVSGPFNNTTGTGFSAPIEMTLASQFPARFGTTFWDDTATFTVPGANYPATTELVTFSGLNLTLGAGTYFLQAQGGDVAWGGGNTPLASTVGTLGLNWICDPTANCTPDRVQPLAPGYYGAFDLIGTPLAAATPEPATWVLSGTGLLSLGLLGWSKASRAGV